MSRSRYLPDNFTLALVATVTLASLWPVEDAAALRLMRAFYRRLAGSSDRAQALTEAKRELRQGRGGATAAHPFLWASWRLVDHAPSPAHGLRVSGGTPTAAGKA